MVMNAAFEEVMKLRRYDCIIFHDVDMIPENDKNLYLCGSQPRHLSPGKLKISARNIVCSIIFDIFMKNKEKYCDLYNKKVQN